MTQISRDDVLNLARLSSISLSDPEIDSLQANLGDILEYVAQLNELDTAGVMPAYQVTGLKNVTREDKVVESSVTREALLALAPESQNNHIKVPKVL